MAKLIIQGLKGHFVCRRPAREGARGWTIDDITLALDYVRNNYQPVGRRKVEFTRAQIAELFNWILFKRQPPYDKKVSQASLFESMTMRQRAFCQHYTGDAFGNAAKAARLAGYSAKRAKQTAYDLMHFRKKY